MRSKRRDVDLLTALDEIQTNIIEEGRFNDKSLIKTVDIIQQAGVRTYVDLYTLIRNNSQDLAHHKQAIRVLGWLATGIIKTDRNIYYREQTIYIDRRSAFSALRIVLNSDDDSLRILVIEELGILNHRGATPLLGKILLNKKEPEAIRLNALVALSRIGDPRNKDIFARLSFDESEPNLDLRGNAIERLAFYEFDEVGLERYMTLLRHESDVIRFWAAYGLVCFSDESEHDLSKHFALIDSVVAHDTVIHKSESTGYWWHINRELAPALEHIYAQKLLPRSYSEYSRPYTMLISPQLEYWDFRQAKQAGKPTPEPTLNIAPEWLAGQLRAKWQNVKINVREPKPQAMILDWLVEIDGDLLMGGLHRDGYGVFITSHGGNIETFAKWYRSIIADEHKLYLYEWAEPGQAIITT